MEICLKQPSILTQEEFDKIRLLVLEGGETDPNFIEDRLCCSALISFVIEEKQIIAVAILKVPDPLYRHRIFEQAQSPEIENMYNYELGYIFVLPDFRGKKISSKLCDLVCGTSSLYGTFATVRQNNNAMRRILEKNHFSITGTGYLNQKKTDYLLLYVRHGKGLLCCTS
jgi:GNAT superfamily N-acetyltransferase